MRPSFRIAQDNALTGILTPCHALLILGDVGWHNGDPDLQTNKLKIHQKQALQPCYNLQLSRGYLLLSFL
jgi:hypothetical protein